MKTTDISSKEIRYKIGELLNFVFYGGGQVRITRRKRVMAYLVGEPLMTVFNQLIEDDPALADTVALMLNKELMRNINTCQKDTKSEKKKPYKSAIGAIQK